jgi:hypothetical protein
MTNTYFLNVIHPRADNTTERITKIAPALNIDICSYSTPNMPPIRSENPKRLVEQEGRIALAIAAYKNGQIPSINRTAALFNVPQPTLYY